MKKDQSLTRRRALLAGAAAVGAAGTAGLLYSGLSDDAPVRAAAPAAGPPPRLARKPSSYRLQPVAGYGAPTPPPPVSRCGTNRSCACRDAATPWS